MVGSDEPQLQVQVVGPLLHTNEVKEVVMLHAIHTVDLVLVLPGEFVLEATEHGKVSGEDAWMLAGTIKVKEWYLDGEDLYGHIVAQQLCFPHTTEAPPCLYLNELQGLVSQNGGGRGWSGVLSKCKSVCGGAGWERKWNLKN